MVAGGDEHFLLRQDFRVQEGITGSRGAEREQQGVQSQTWRPVLALSLSVTVTQASHCLSLGCSFIFCKMGDSGSTYPMDA